MAKKKRTEGSDGDSSGPRRSLEEEHQLQELRNKREHRRKIDQGNIRGVDWVKRRWGIALLVVGAIFLLGGLGTAAAANLIVGTCVLLPGLVFLLAGALYASGKFDVDR